MNGQPLAACLAIFLAMMLDGADGRIARMTAPKRLWRAIRQLVRPRRLWCGSSVGCFLVGAFALGQLGWVAAFAYMARAALRLARFNVDGEEGSFTGLAVRQPRA